MSRARKGRQPKKAKYIFVEGKSEKMYFDILRQNEKIPNLQVFHIGSHATSLWNKSKQKMTNDPSTSTHNYLTTSS